MVKYVKFVSYFQNGRYQLSQEQKKIPGTKLDRFIDVKYSIRAQNGPH